MCHRYRAASGYLLSEQWNHRPPAAQHIAESDGDKLCFALGGDILHDEFRHPFCYPHDTGGVYRLIGGDHDEFLDAEFG